MPATSAVATLVGRELGVAIGADQPEVLARVVGRVAVDMVKHQCQRGAVPLAGNAAEGAPTLLLGQQMQADVVVAATPGKHDPSGQPGSDALLTLESALETVAAEAPLWSSFDDLSTPVACEHHDRNARCWHRQSRVRDSNSRLSHYKGDALPTELTRHALHGARTLYEGSVLTPNSRVVRGRNSPEPRSKGSSSNEDVADSTPVTGSTQVCHSEHWSARAP